MQYRVRIMLKTLVPIAMMIWLASDSRYFTTWLAGVWGMVALIGLLQNEKEPSGQPALKMPDDMQFMLAVILIAATCIATNWRAPGPREAIQAVFMISTLDLYRRGFDWCRRTFIGLWSNLRQRLKSFK